MHEQKTQWYTKWNKLTDYAIVQPRGPCVSTSMFRGSSEFIVCVWELACNRDRNDCKTAKTWNIYVYTRARMYMYMYIHTCMHAYIHTCVHRYIDRYRPLVCRGALAGSSGKVQELCTCQSLPSSCMVSTTSLSVAAATLGASARLAKRECKPKKGMHACPRLLLNARATSWSIWIVA